MNAMLVFSMAEIKVMEGLKISIIRARELTE